MTDNSGETPAADSSETSADVAADTVLNEEWWHHRFALRDLAVLTAR